MQMSCRNRAVLAAAVATLAAAGGARAEIVYGAYALRGQAALAYFDTTSPGSVTEVGTVSGLNAGHQLRGIDFRASNSVLYAVSTLGNQGQLYTVNLASGAATALGGGFTLDGLTSSNLSIDFNPFADALRIVSGGGQSYRVNANTGALAARDSDVTGTDAALYGVAYSGNVATPMTQPTTLYAYGFSATADVFGTIGGLNSMPSPNGGVFNTIDSDPRFAESSLLGFDISGATGTGYLSIDTLASAGVYAPGLYTIGLANGALTSIGDLGRNFFDISVSPRGAVALVSTPGSLALAGLGLAALAGMRRRR